VSGGKHELANDVKGLPFLSSVKDALQDKENPLGNRQRVSTAGNLGQTQQVNGSLPLLSVRIKRLNMKQGA